MLVYSVMWYASSDLTKGKGRLKDKEHMISLNVLCRNANDAVCCVSWYFYHVYKCSKPVEFSDGEITIKRVKLDSRNFHANYMMMDGISTPISLGDLKDSLQKLNMAYVR